MKRLIVIVGLCALLCSCDSQLIETENRKDFAKRIKYNGKIYKVTEVKVSDSKWVTVVYPEQDSFQVALPTQNSTQERSGKTTIERTVVELK